MKDKMKEIEYLDLLVKKKDAEKAILKVKFVHILSFLLFFLILFKKIGHPTDIVGVLVVSLVCGIFSYVFSYAVKIIYTMIMYPYDEINKYSKAYADYFVIPELKKKFNNLSYNKEKGIDKTIISNIKIINRFDNFVSNDYIEAYYKDAYFRQSYVTLEKKFEQQKMAVLFMDKCLMVDGLFLNLINRFNTMFV